MRNSQESHCGGRNPGDTCRIFIALKTAGNLFHSANPFKINGLRHMAKCEKKIAKNLDLEFKRPYRVLNEQYGDSFISGHEAHCVRNFPGNGRPRMPFVDALKCYAASMSNS
jgi:hypothetical protein